ncbi:MAG: hypothetical protein AB1640_09920 [bacterium]
MRPRVFLFAFLSVALVTGMTAVALAADYGESAGSAQSEQTLSGKITDGNKFMSDAGQEYKLKGDMADQLRDHVGERVQITGTVKESGGTPSIEVTNFQRLSEGGAEQGLGESPPMGGSSGSMEGGGSPGMEGGSSSGSGY